MNKITVTERDIVLDECLAFTEAMLVIALSLPLNNNVLEAGTKLANAVSEFVELVHENTVSE
jgi:hypothetical protein